MISEEAKSEHNTSGWASYFKKRTIFDQALMYARLIRTIIHFAPKGGALLEVGCGSGLTSILLQDLGYEVVLCDIDREVLSQVEKRKRRYNADMSLVRMDMRSLDFMRDSFDVVFHQGLLEHFDDKSIVRALREQKNVGKVVIFEVPNSRAKLSYGDERLLPPRYWRRLIRQAGLNVVFQYGTDLNYLGALWPYGIVYASYDVFGRFFGRNSGFVCAQS